MYGTIHFIIKSACNNIVLKSIIFGLNSLMFTLKKHTVIYFSTPFGLLNVISSTGIFSQKLMRVGAKEARTHQYVFLTPC